MSGLARMLSGPARRLARPPVRPCADRTHAATKTRLGYRPKSQCLVALAAAGRRPRHRQSVVGVLTREYGRHFLALPPDARDQNPGGARLLDLAWPAYRVGDHR